MVTIAGVATLLALHPVLCFGAIVLAIPFLSVNLFGEA